MKETGIDVAVLKLEILDIIQQECVVSTRVPKRITQLQSGIVLLPTIGY